MNDNITKDIYEIDLSRLPRTDADIVLVQSAIRGHPFRVEILDSIFRHTAGRGDYKSARLQDIKQEVDIPTEDLEEHLGALVDAKIIEELGIGSARLYFPRHTPPTYSTARQRETGRQLHYPPKK